jgi:hypothetical protein
LQKVIFSTLHLQLSSSDYLPRQTCTAAGVPSSLSALRNRIQLGRWPLTRILGSTGGGRETSTKTDPGFRSIIIEKEDYRTLKRTSGRLGRLEHQKVRLPDRSKAESLRKTTDLFPSAAVPRRKGPPKLPGLGEWWRDASKGSLPTCPKN